MVFNTGAALLDAIVLAVVSKEPEGTYGYKITQDVRGVLDSSAASDVYKRQQLNLYKIEWKNYSTKIGSMFEDAGRNADSGHMREEN